MMESLHAACEESDYLFKKVKNNNCASSVPQELEANHERTSKASFCILTKLRELHKREYNSSINSSNRKGLVSNSFLLEKLVAEERLNTLVLILHPGNKGYTLSCRWRNQLDPHVNMDDDCETVIKTGSYLYEWPALSDYINHQVLPKFFADLLLSSYNFLFYNGWIVTQIRDYRQTFPALNCDIHHVLLKHHYMGILSDVNQIIEEKDWGVEEKLQLESSLIASYNPKLCLEPTTSLCRKQSRLNYTTQILNRHTLESNAHKYSQKSIIRKRKLDRIIYKPGLKLHDFVQNAKRSAAASTSVSALLGEKIRKVSENASVPNLELESLPLPSQISIDGFHAKQPTDNTDFLPQLREQHVLECDINPKGQDKQPRVYYTRLSILQRPSDSEYIGELYLDPNYKKEGHLNEVACRFPLGTKAHADRYLKQFMEIFTEGDGRKWVRTNPGHERTSQSQMLQSQQSPPQQIVYAQHQLQHVAAQVFQHASAGSSYPTGNMGSPLVLPTNNMSYTGQVSHLKPSLVPEVTALASELESSCQQFIAAAQQQQKQQKLAAININLQNSAATVSEDNADAATIVNNSMRVSLLATQQQKQTLNQKLLVRKMTFSNAANTTRRVVNSDNMITVNSAANVATQLGQQVPHVQTIGTTSPPAPAATFTSGGYASIPIKQQISTYFKS